MLIHLQDVVSSYLPIVERTADLEIHVFPLVFNLMGAEEGHLNRANISKHFFIPFNVCSSAFVSKNKGKVKHFIEEKMVKILKFSLDHRLQEKLHRPEQVDK